MSIVPVDAMPCMAVREFVSFQGREAVSVLPSYDRNSDLIVGGVRRRLN